VEVKASFSTLCKGTFTLIPLYNCCTVLEDFFESGLERQERLARAFVCSLPMRIFGYTELV
jgi:hypothetical protein